MKRNKLSFEWHSILSDIVRNIWVVILSALIGFFGYYALTQSSYEPAYTSKATISITTRSDGVGTYSTFTLSSEMAKVFTNFLEDPMIRELAAERAGEEWFDGKLGFYVLPNTNFIEVTVTSDNPIKSYRLLNAVLESHPEISRKVFRNANVNIIRMPNIPSGPSNSVDNGDSDLVTLGCAVVAFAMIVAFSLLRNTVKKEADFDEKIESKLIGTVVHESKRMKLSDIRRKKKTGLLIHSNAFISLRFTENFHKIAAKLEHKKKRGDGNVYAVTSVAENEGKSTCAANIAVSLADRGNRVVLVDLDFKKPALYKIFSEKPAEGQSLSDLLDGKTEYKDFEFISYKKISLSLALNAHAAPKGKSYISDSSVAGLIGQLKKDFDFVIVDTAPLSLDSSVTDIIQNVDKTILVIRTDTVNVNAINDHITTISKISANLAGCILNNVYMNLLPFSFTGNDESGRYGAYSYGKHYGYGHYGHYGHFAKQHEAEDKAIGQTEDIQAFAEK